MPTYQYGCTACGHELEAVQSFTDDALTECPACGGDLRKRFSAVGIVFKGSGFYRTDSRSGSSSTTTSTKTADSSGASSSASSSDSKSTPESKSSTSSSSPSKAAAPTPAA